MPTKEQNEMYTHKKLKASIKAEISRVSRRAADSFILEPNKVLTIYFIETTPFSTWWNLHVKNEFPYERKAFVAFVRSMCEVYRISRKNVDAHQPELFEQQQAA